MTRKFKSELYFSNSKNISSKAWKSRSEETPSFELGSPEVKFLLLGSFFLPAIRQVGRFGSFLGQAKNEHKKNI
ncbi:hypothetical protein [Aestuariivivens sediminicola]|uniref:hypothetical protein n=1 Tax=Aestuariivivens sediminicola TaxID=2913560 RepID=UPI001F5878E3|nr:hypothetical protein [Aestuariivivens sediminicola]